MATKNKRPLGQALKKGKAAKKSAPVKAESTDVLCPTCGPHGDVVNGKCRLCGARRTVNSVSGNVIWMRNGRLVQAFRDSREAFVRMATKFNVSRDQWPAEFLN